MSDQDAAVLDDAQTTPDERTPDAPQGDADDDRRGGSKAVLADLAKERRQRQAAEKRLKELEDAQLSELDRAKKEAEQARRDAESARAEALRFRVAAEFQIGSEDAELLAAVTDEDAMRKLAARLGAARKDDASGAAAKPAPKADKSQGARGGAAGSAGSDQVQAAIARRYGHQATA
jgi:hypothetical protein